MYEAELQLTTALELREELEDSTVILPISLGAKSDQNNIEKFKANLASLESVKRIVIVPADLLQVDTLMAEFPDKTEKQLMIEAFRLCVQWLKSIAPEILKLNVDFEILPWHQIIYTNFKEHKVGKLFYRPNGLNAQQALQKTYENIDRWADIIEKALSNDKLVENEQYTRYLERTMAMKKSDKVFEGQVNGSAARFQQKFTGDKERNKSLCEAYVLKESAVYWMWNDSGLYQYSAYAGDLNAAMKHIQQSNFESKNLNHIKFKYVQKELTLKPKARMSTSAPPTLERGAIVSIATSDSTTKSLSAPPSPTKAQQFAAPPFNYTPAFHRPIPAVPVINQTIASLAFGIGEIHDEDARNQLFDKLLATVLPSSTSSTTTTQQDRYMKPTMTNQTSSNY